VTVEARFAILAVSGGRWQYLLCCRNYKLTTTALVHLKRIFQIMDAAAAEKDRSAVARCLP
jgi:hypothetical protein